MILDDVLTAENSNPDNLNDAEREAWQRLVDSGIVWQLTGFFGRTASRLMRQGVLTDHVGNDTR
jgi:hypothetical protein